MLHTLFMREGHRVDTAADGEEALDIMSRRQYHMVISDIKMPRMHGYELLKSVKEKYPRAVVVMMTSYGDSYAIKDCLLLGADEYIAKPFKNSAINLVVERAYWRVRTLWEIIPTQ